MTSPHDAAWRSRRGWFTLVLDPRAAGLVPLEISETQTKTIRAYDGFLYDREGFARMGAEQWSSRLDQGKFLQFGKHKIFVFTRKTKEIW